MSSSAQTPQRARLQLLQAAAWIKHEMETQGTIGDLQLVRQHKSRLRSMSNCFLGSEAVEWAVSRRLAGSRAAAEMLFDDFWIVGALQHVSNKDTTFKDEQQLYRWQEVDALVEKLSAEQRQMCVPESQSTLRHLEAELLRLHSQISQRVANRQNDFVQEEQPLLQQRVGALANNILVLEKAISSISSKQAASAGFKGMANLNLIDDYKPDSRYEAPSAAARGEQSGASEEDDLTSDEEEEDDSGNEEDDTAFRELRSLKKSLKEMQKELDEQKKKLYFPDAQGPWTLRVGAQGNFCGIRGAVLDMFDACFSLSVTLEKGQPVISLKLDPVTIKGSLDALSTVTEKESEGGAEGAGGGGGAAASTKVPKQRGPLSISAELSLEASFKYKAGTAGRKRTRRKRKGRKKAKGEQDVEELGVWEASNFSFKLRHLSRAEGAGLPAAMIQWLVNAFAPRFMKKIMLSKLPAELGETILGVRHVSPQGPGKEADIAVLLAVSGRLSLRGLPLAVMEQRLQVQAQSINHFLASTTNSSNSSNSKSSEGGTGGSGGSGQRQKTLNVADLPSLHRIVLWLLATGRDGGTLNSNGGGGDGGGSKGRKPKPLRPEQGHVLAGLRAKLPVLDKGLDKQSMWKATSKWNSLASLIKYTRLLDAEAEAKEARAIVFYLQRVLSSFCLVANVPPLNLQAILDTCRRLDRRPVEAQFSLSSLSLNVELYAATRLVENLWLKSVRQQGGEMGSMWVEKTVKLVSDRLAEINHSLDKAAALASSGELKLHGSLRGGSDGNGVFTLGVEALRLALHPGVQLPVKLLNIVRNPSSTTTAFSFYSAELAKGGFVCDVGVPPSYLLVAPPDGGGEGQGDSVGPGAGKRCGRGRGGAGPGGGGSSRASSRQHSRVEAAPPSTAISQPDSPSYSSAEAEAAAAGRGSPLEGGQQQAQEQDWSLLWGELEDDPALLLGRAILLGKGQASKVAPRGRGGLVPFSSALPSVAQHLLVDAIHGPSRFFPGSLRLVRGTVAGISLKLRMQAQDLIALIAKHGAEATLDVLTLDFGHSSSFTSAAATSATPAGAKGSAVGAGGGLEDGGDAKDAGAFQVRVASPPRSRLELSVSGLRLIGAPGVTTRWMLASLRDAAEAQARGFEVSEKGEEGAEEGEEKKQGSGTSTTATRVALWSFLRDIKSERMSMDFDAEMSVKTSKHRIDLSLFGNSKSGKGGSVMSLSNVYYLVDIFFDILDIKEAKAENKNK